MAVKMQCDVFQKEIAGDADDASQICSHKWYFSRKEIESHSPSRSDGIDYKHEEHLRKLYCSFLQELGMELKVPQVTIATAMMFCHRFYMRQSHAKNDWQTIATVCMFLACKAEETPRWLGELVVVAYKLVYKWDPSASRRIREIYDKQKELILIGERLLLHVLAFDLNIEHPYKSLVAALKILDITDKDLVKVAWNFVNDWLRTLLCLQHKPHYIAAGSLFLATKIMKVKLPTSKGKPWWMEFDVSPKQLEDVIQQMTSLWQRSQSQTPALKNEKVTKAPNRKATTTTSNCVKKVVFEKVNHTSREMTNGQTSDTGSGASVVEDGDICEPVTVKSELRSPIRKATTTTSNCVKKEVIEKVNHTSRETINDQTSDTGSGASVVEDGDICEPVTVKSELISPIRKATTTTSNCVKKEVFEKVNDTSRETTNGQTSDTGSGVSVVEDGDIGEPGTVKSVLSSSCKTVNLVGGNSATVDINKIREKLKKRNLIKTMKRARVEEDIDDGEDWIERELENGIVLQSTNPVKQRKICNDLPPPLFP